MTADELGEDLMALCEMGFVETYHDCQLQCGDPKHVRFRIADPRINSLSEDPMLSVGGV